MCVCLHTLSHQNRILDIRYLISVTSYQISVVRYQMSDARYQISDIRYIYQILDFRFYILHFIFCILHLNFRFRQQILDTRYQIVGIRYYTLDFRHQILDILDNRYYYQIYQTRNISLITKLLVQYESNIPIQLASKVTCRLTEIYIIDRIRQCNCLVSLTPWLLKRSRGKLITSVPSASKHKAVLSSISL